MPTGAPASGRFISEAAWCCLSARLRLSQREQQIARMILDDFKELRIAREMGLSVHTVHTHLERLYRKLGVSSRVQLVVRLASCHLAVTAEPGSLLPPICAKASAGLCPLDG
ncbi:MAG: helix-turn-helix transcriptional regulator [Phycisphaeraceae bacterium]